MNDKPFIMITGADGALGRLLTQAFKFQYQIIRIDRPGNSCDVEIDLSRENSVNLGMKLVAEKFGRRLKAVFHLAAYFDFSGKDSPLYQALNVDGTRYLLNSLQDFEVDRFIYPSTMLIHKPCSLGETINEDWEVSPKWAYPKSKAAAEETIEHHAKDIPYTIVRLAGIYSDTHAVPTLAHQISRIYEKDFKSAVYAGDKKAGQSFLHTDDMLALFENLVERSDALPKKGAYLVGETETLSYQVLQNQIGCLIHGDRVWKTYTVPELIAKGGAWMEEQAEPVVPDHFDKGEEPFIRPFMIDLASDHYALDTSKIKKAIDWEPTRSLKDTLPTIIENLKKDPSKWYEQNGIVEPQWMESADDLGLNAEKVRVASEDTYLQQHKDNLWAPMMNMALGLWLLFSPFSLGYESDAMAISDYVSGAVVLLLGLLSCSPKIVFRLSRWALGVVGLWLMSAPLIFWAPTAEAYLNGTIIGTLVMCFAMATRPFPGMSPTAQLAGPAIPKGWAYSPSDWEQRIPIIFLAFIGFFISRYMAAYQLGHIDAVWDPFFSGAINADGKNGTEEIITSSVSEAWPVPDAGLGALTYLLEIVTGIIGSRNRWRTMPWLVLIFGFMIVPLGAVSITFIIIQPVILDTWCTLCLIAAAAMLIQIPYSFDEIVATIDFLRRKAKAGKPWMLIMFTGDAEEPATAKAAPENLLRPPGTLVKDMLGGGVGLPIPFVACGLIGVALMCTRVLFDTSGSMANTDHTLGALIITVSIAALAEVARPLRFVNMFLGVGLLISPFIFDTSLVSAGFTFICGLLVIGLSTQKGKFYNEYGSWTRYAKV